VRQPARCARVRGRHGPGARDEGSQPDVVAVSRYLRMLGVGYYTLDLVVPSPFGCPLPIAVLGASRLRLTERSTADGQRLKRAEHPRAGLARPVFDHDERAPSFERHDL
jgi:hypothetical protein